MCVYPINPFDTLNVLSRHAQQWQAALLGNYDTSVLAPYWEHMRSTSWGRDGVSNMFKSAKLWDRRSKVFPTFWHSDGGEVYAGGKIWSIYHASTPFSYDKDPKDAKLYILMVEEALFCEETEEELTVYFIWCQNVLESGIFPYTDHLKKPIGPPWNKKSGEPIAGGFGMSFSGWTGDLKAGAGGLVYIIDWNGERSKIVM